MKFIDKIAGKILLRGNDEELQQSLYSIIKDKAKSINPEESLKFLFALEDRIYQLEGRESIRYGNGIHTKHKHIKYHDFFIDNIPEGSRVLDVGCGNGTLTFDIAKKVLDVYIYGIDIVADNIEKAKERFSKENIQYRCGDALTDLPDHEIDVIVLSNVLEHIEHRVAFLTKLKNRYHPGKILVRVPLFERDWRVPLKKELGIDYRLDSTHHIEYIQEDFFQEINKAGLELINYQIKWGEIWAEIQ